MKRKYTLFLLCFLCVGVSFSQSRGINYKALISDTNGSTLANQNVTVQFTILEGNMGTNEVYKESHTTTTDANGIIIVNIGEGTNISGDFTTINWGLDTHFLKTEIDTGSGFVDLGTTEFKTVPYALYAENSGGSVTVSPFSESAINRITATNTNANFVVGSTSTEDQNSVNLDSRMFFDKSRVAFRAGSVDGTQWDNSNRGLYSFAGGRNNTADGIASTVFGENNQVSGYGATVLGRQNTANGSNSLVAGFGNISSNQINAQTVIGKWNEIETDALFIIGNGADDLTRKNVLSVKSDGNIIAPDLDVVEITQANALVTKAYVDANSTTPSTGLVQLDEGNGNGWRLIGQDANNYGNIGLNAVDLSSTTFPSTTHGATGSYAFTAGIVTTASGFGATALGNGSTASGDNAFAAGGANIASGENSAALGLSSQASGNSSFAIGEQSDAIGNYSLAGGLSSTAVEQYSFAFGNNAVATGGFSFAFGRINEAAGNYSFSFGEDTDANGNFSFSVGANNVVDGDFSAAFGIGHTINGSGAMATGFYSGYDPNAIFSVGNGSSGTPNTAFKVVNSGVVSIQNLAGTGTRNVSVDASGNLVANSTQDSDMIVITPFDFVKENEDNGIAMTRHTTEGAYITVPGDDAAIYAPVQLPQAATITKVEYVYTDTNIQTGRALDFRIRYNSYDSNTTNDPGLFFISSSNLNTNSYPSSNRLAATTNFSFAVTPEFNTNLYRAFFVEVKPVSGGQWSGTSDMAIIQVRIHYTY